MSPDKIPSETNTTRPWLAYIVLLVSTAALAVLAVVAIANDPENAQQIFNVLVPVFATWVGTVLAYYFGKEQYETANQRVWSLVDQLTPEQRAAQLIKSIMRPFSEMVCFQVPPATDEKKVKLADLQSKFANNISRLPILDDGFKPLYMIHESAIDKYLTNGGSPEDSLADFLDKQKKAGFEYGLDKGFVLVAESCTLGLAKLQMERVSSCQDIFVTKNGKSADPVLGWVSNVRMSKYLEP